MPKVVMFYVREIGSNLTNEGRKNGLSRTILNFTLITLRYEIF